VAFFTSREICDIEKLFLSVCVTNKQRCKFRSYSSNIFALKVCNYINMS